MEVVFEVASYVFWVLVAITILVFVHEMGHFLTAKWFGMRVERFSIGFPPKIFGKRFGETEYVVGATPLGGYVKISGMVDESMDADEMTAEPQPWEYRAKPVWQRMVVITAGVIFNIFLAVLIFAGLKLAYGDAFVPAENIDSYYVQEGSVAYDMGLRTGDKILEVGGEAVGSVRDIESPEALLADPFTVTVLRAGDTLRFEGPQDVMTQMTRAGGTLGIDYLPSLVGDVVEGNPAEEAGLRRGDRIVALGGEPVRFWSELTERIEGSEGAPLTVRFARPDSLADAAPADAEVVAQRPGATVYETMLTPEEAGDGRYVLGIYPLDVELLQQEYGVQYRSYGPIAALGAGATETWTTASAIVTSLQRVVSGREDVRENVGGPIAIAKITKQAADRGARVFWGIVAMLSVTLAIMNILPIPALDGGHLMFLVYEAIARREPSLRLRMAMQQVGMVLLLLLMVFLVFNDILRF